MLTLSLPSMSGPDLEASAAPLRQGLPLGTCCPGAGSWEAPAPTASHLHSRSYPAFFPFGAAGWLPARAAGLHLGRNMERGGFWRPRRCLQRLRVPACSARRRWQWRGTRWSIASRDPESPCATWGLTASSVPRQWCLGPRINLGIPLWRQKERPQPLLPCLSSGPRGQILPPWRAAPSSSPTALCGFAPPRAWQARSREQEQRCWLQALQGHCSGWPWL